NGTPPMPLFVSVLCCRRQAVMPALSALGRCVSRRAVQHRLLCTAHDDGGAGDGVQARRLRPHLRRCPSLSQSPGTGAAAVVPRAATPAGDAAQSGGEGHFRISVRGLRGRKLRPSSSYKGRGGRVACCQEMMVLLSLFVCIELT